MLNLNLIFSILFLANTILASPFRTSFEYQKQDDYNQDEFDQNINQMMEKAMAEIIDALQDPNTSPENIHELECFLQLREC